MERAKNADKEFEAVEGDDASTLNNKESQKRWYFLERFMIEKRYAISD
jgi:hypothetical protein